MCHESSFASTMLFKRFVFPFVFRLREESHGCIPRMLVSFIGFFKLWCSMGTHYIRVDYIRPVPSASIWVLASFLSLRYFLSPAGNSRALAFDLLVIFSPPLAYISLVILLSLTTTKPAFVGRSRKVADRSSIVSKLAKSTFETLTSGHPTPRLLFFRPKSSRASSRSILLEHDHNVQMPTI